MAPAAARIPAGCRPRTDHRQLRRTLGLRRPCGNLIFGAARELRPLGCAVGTSGPDPLYAFDRLSRGSGALRPPTLFSAYPAGR